MQQEENISHSGYGAITHAVRKTHTDSIFSGMGSLMSEEGGQVDSERKIAVHTFISSCTPQVPEDRSFIS